MNLSALEQAFDAREAGGAGQREALDALIANGLPTRKSELWKYTKAAPLAEFAITALTAASATTDTDAARARAASNVEALQGAGRLVFIDGVLDDTLTQLPEDDGIGSLLNIVRNTELRRDDRERALFWLAWPGPLSWYCPYVRQSV